MKEQILENNFKPQFSLSLVEQVVDYLTEAIVRRKIKGGERLVESKLGAHFGISRAPVREALRVLEQNGLVTIYPRKGAFVKEISNEYIVENLVIRACLEGLAARIATPRLSEQDIKHMEQELRQMRKAANGNLYHSYRENHIAFHLTFIWASGNVRLIEMLENLRRQVFWFRSYYVHTVESFKGTIKVHRQILDAFIARDVRKAEKLVSEHIHLTLDAFLKSVRDRANQE